MAEIYRRNFLRAASASGMVASGCMPLAFPKLLPVTREQALLDDDVVKFSADIEPLVKLIEETPRNRVIEEVGVRIRDGKLSYRELLAGLFLAAVRNVEPRPSVGFKFHAVLVVNSCHLASLASPDRDRWLPLLWAVDNFKASQARDVREGNWTMLPVREAAVPSPSNCRKAFQDAMESWDVEAADVATAGLVRNHTSNEVFEEFARYAARDFRSIGHKAIFLANAYRTLQCIGWQYAEPVMRSLSYALLNHVGEPLPSENDLLPDRDWRSNEELAEGLPDNWQWGARTEGRTEAILDTLRTGSSQEVASQVATMLSEETSLQSISDAMFLGSGELLMRQPGIVGLHTLTTTNAIQYLIRTCQSEQTRRRLVLQNASFLPRFRAAMESRGDVADRSVGLLQDSEATSNDSDNSIFELMGRNRVAAAKLASSQLTNATNVEEFIHEARRLVFATGNDSHDYKFSSAILEDHYHLSPQWRPTYLACSTFQLPAANQKTQPIVEKIREMFG